MIPSETMKLGNEAEHEPNQSESGVMVDGKRVTLEKLSSMKSAEGRLRRFAIVVDKLRLDALVGFLFPEVGDMATATLALYPVLEAVNAGVPRSVIVRMLINVGADMGIGFVPVAGDLVDAFFHANVKNHKLFAEHLAQVEKEFANHPEHLRKAREKGAVHETRAKVDGVLKGE